MAFQYKNETAYQKALNAVVNPQAFQYNAQEDPLFQAYRRQYLADGERAAADALAKASAATGGVPSSYAVTAAQQAGSNYAAKAAEIIPTLEKTAYSRYLQGLENQQNALTALANDRSTSYQQYLKELELAEAAKKAQEQAAAVQESTKAAAIPQSQITALQTKYPSKVITDGALWNNMVSLYGADSMAAAGFTNQESKGSGTEGYTVTNKNGSGWVSVDGVGRMRWAELMELVNQGKVIETVDDAAKKITYRYAK